MILKEKRNGNLYATAYPLGNCMVINECSRAGTLPPFKLAAAI